MQIFKQSEDTAADRRFYLFLVDATDGLTPETGEAGGQPQISKNGGALTDTSATLSDIGNGYYYVELTATELDTLGKILVRYKSANTCEFGDIALVQAADFNIAPGAAGGVAIVGSQVDLVNTPNSTAVAAIKTGIAGAQMDIQDVPNATAITAINAGQATAANVSAVEAKVDTIDGVVDAIKVVADAVATMYETDGSVKRFTTNALEQAVVNLANNAVTADVIDQTGLTAIQTPLAKDADLDAVSTALTNAALQIAAINTAVSNLPDNMTDNLLLNTTWVTHAATAGSLAKMLLTQALAILAKNVGTESTGALVIYGADGTTPAVTQTVSKTGTTVGQRVITRESDYDPES